MSAVATWAPVYLAIGWAAHAADWLTAVVRRGGRVAHSGEWGREVTVRVAMFALIAWALADPRGAPGAITTATAGFLFAAGTAVAIVGRQQLGAAWGIGVRPHAPAYREGSYALLRHPIYLGTTAALLGQFILLQNPQSLALLLAACIVVPLKIARERSWLSR